MTDYIVYLINLDSSTERLASAQRQLSSVGLEFIRVPAFDGRGLTPDQFPHYDAPAAMRYMGRPLWGGEIGCYLSHLDCAKRFLASDRSVALVLEDDCEIVPEMPQVLERALAHLHDQGIDWSVINIGSFRRMIYTVIAEFSAHGQVHQLSHAHYFPTSGPGIVWSRNAAQAFVDNHDRIFAHFEIFLRHWLTRADTGLSIWPPIVRPAGMVSDIDATPQSRSAQGRSVFYDWRKQKRLWVDKVLGLKNKFARKSWEHRHARHDIGAKGIDIGAN